LAGFFQTGEFIFKLKDDSTVYSDLLSIEKKYSYNLSRITIATVYCTPGENRPLHMFTNQNPPKSFISFLRFLGVPAGRKSSLEDSANSAELDVLDSNRGESTSGSYQTEWKNTTIVWHVASEMSDEAHRRLIGNSPVILFFMESTQSSFPMEHISTLGYVHQFYCIVQLHSPGKYRLGFFRRRTLDQFDPLIPANYLFDPISMRDFLLFKIFNAYMTLQVCPPFNRMYEEPRGSAIKEFCEKHAKQFMKQFQKIST